MNTGILTVKPGESYLVTVGSGGIGALENGGNTVPDNSINGNSDGGNSAFGTLISAAGGKTPRIFAVGADGGSG